MRATLAPGNSPSQRFSQVKGLSGRASAAVRRLEAEKSRPGCLADSMAVYERFLRSPGRVLYPPTPNCPCHGGPLPARDEIEEFLRRLPPVHGSELRRLVAGLDRKFERRTLYDPCSWYADGDRGWWWLRVMGFN